MVLSRVVGAILGTEQRRRSTRVRYAFMQHIKAITALQMVLRQQSSEMDTVRRAWAIHKLTHSLTHTLALSPSLSLTHTHTLSVTHTYTLDGDDEDGLAGLSRAAGVAAPTLLLLRRDL